MQQDTIGNHLFHKSIGYFLWQVIQAELGENFHFNPTQF
jgi:hypothetical protein